MTTVLKACLPLLLGALLLAALLSFATTARADLAAQESNLNPLGSAFEINPDDQGILWISDFDAGEIWGVDSVSGAYSIYAVGGTPSDARRSGEHLWWADSLSNALGRVSTSDGSYYLWNVPGSSGFYGTEIDAQGRIWVNDSSYPYTYRLDPAAGELCTYTLPLEGVGSYLTVDGGHLWLGDTVNSRLLRLEMDTDTLAWWSLPADSTPIGMALDGQGALWYADPNNGELARLDPPANQLERYNLPVGSLPQMVAVSGENIWYTEHWEASIGRLNPYVASREVFTPTHDSSLAVPHCAGISPASSGTLAIGSGTLSWGMVDYATLVDAGGWFVNELPVHAYPWGITAIQGQIWWVDSGRQVLAQVQDSLSVTACTLADGDGDPNTSGDQTPLAGWEVQLIAGATPVEPPKLTGPTGCVMWSELEAGVSYGVQEQLPEGWVSLGATSHEFGALLPGEAYVHRFLNMENVQVTACTVSDSDGDPSTNGDQTPLPGQTIYLHVDGTRQEPGRITSADGCHTWSDLAPNHTCAVEQAESDAYTNLGDALHDFGTLAPGAAPSHTFVNAESVAVSACSVSDADGDSNTSGDQAPLPGQTVTLHVDGVRQEPGELTGADGCHTWDDLAPNHSYAVEQADSDAYTNLGDASHDFGALAPGAAASHTFINAESVAVSACSVSDADGDLNTSGDQAPLPDQTVYLQIDNARQEPGELTGADGCHTWSDLAPNQTYAVEQGESATYTNLGDASHDFGALAPGAAASHTFINAESVAVSACSVSDADGDLNTTGDQAPLPDQTVYQQIDTARQEPGELTGADGCHAWEDLAPNLTYGVEQAVAPGWELLTPSSYDFDLAQPGEVFQGTFISRQTSHPMYLPLLLRGASPLVVGAR